MDKFKESKEDLKANHRYNQLKEELKTQNRLTDLQALEIRCNWDELRGAEVITYDSCDVLETYSNAQENDRLSLITDNTERSRLATAFTSVVQKTDQADVLQKTLALIWQAMTESQRLIFFPNQQKEIEITSHLIIMLNRHKDEYILGKSACVISQIIKSGQVSEKHCDSFNAWVLENLLKIHGDLLVDVLLATKNALYNKQFMANFVRSHGSTMHLYKVLQKNPNQRQIVYLTVFCYWLLSFEEENHTQSCLVKPNLFQILVNTLGDRLKPKIVRVALMFFQNMLSSNEARELMVMKGLVAVSKRLSNDKWNDKDITDSLSALLNHLHKDVKQMSSFEQYEKEIKTGQLQRGPVHSPAFWKTNHKQFEKNDFALIKKLIELLAVQDDNETVATALYDLGEFSRFYPKGRELIDTLHGRERILYHLSSDTPVVQEQALLALQKLLVKGWNTMGGAVKPTIEEQKGD